MVNSFIKKIFPDWIYARFTYDWDRNGFKKYLGNTGWVLFSRIITIIIGFLTTIFLIRYLGPTNYGSLSYATSFVGLFSIFASLGLPAIFYRDLLLYPENRHALMGTATILHFIGGFTSTLCIVVIAYVYLEPDISRLTIIILSTTLIFTAYQPIVSEFAANVEQKYTSMAGIVVVLALNILKLAVIFFNQGVLWFVFILFLEPILYGAIFFVLRTRRYGSISKWCFDKVIAKHLLTAAWPFIFIGGFTALYTRIDQIILKHLLGPESVGVYDVAVRLSELWLFVPGIVVSSLYPAIVNARKSNLYEYKRRLVYLLGMLTSLAIIIALILTMLAKPLVTFLYGHVFIPSIPLLQIYAWSGVLLAINTVIQQFLITEHKRYTIFLTTFLAAIVNILLNFVLIPLYGTTGAAWATLISYVILILPIMTIINFRTNRNSMSKPTHDENQNPPI